ncbi:MAG: hypothetical protein K8W52_18545, partial [Deltaproteobacteria bacterium]|nr:hypothetical protein [Deltaproteobacteria bacterium]
YNLRDQLSSYSGGSGGVFRYLFLQYDGQNRLASVNGSRNEQFTYDPLGNMTSHTGTAYGPAGPATLGLGSYSYPTNGVQVHAATTAGDRSFTYDPAGNLLDELKAGHPSRRFVWDEGNLPTEVGVFVDDGDAVDEPADWQTTRYSYGDDGRRLKAVSPTGEVTYTLFPEVEHNASGQLSKAYFFGGRVVARADESGLRTYFHADRLSSTALVTDEVGQPVPSGAYDYAAFGEPLAGAPGAAHGFLFTGARQDRATAAEAGGGLLDLNARLYDPITARFISADTVTTGPGVLGHNRYAYASQNPLNRIDPTGHTDEPATPVQYIDFEDDVVYGDKRSQDIAVISFGAEVRGPGSEITAHVDDTRSADRASVSTLAQISGVHREMMTYLPGEPGTSYGTALAAGVAGLMYYNDISRVEGIEAGGYVVRNGDDTYSFTAALRGEEESLLKSVEDEPAAAVITLHTHGVHSTLSIGEENRFSSDDVDGARRFARRGPDRTSMMISPQGYIHILNPRGNKVSLYAEPEDIRRDGRPAAVPRPWVSK